MGIALSSLPSSRVVVSEKSVYKWDRKGEPCRLCDGQQAFGFILDLFAIHSELIEEIARFEAVA